MNIRRALLLLTPAAGLLLASLGIRPAAVAQTAPPGPKATPESLAFFESKVRPTFVASCIGCHGKENASGGLRLDEPISAAMAAKVLARSKGEGGKPQMPLGMAALPHEKLAELEAWVKQGAPWPTAAAPAHGNLWSLQPVKKPAVPGMGLVENPIDAFLQARRVAAGLTASAPADRRTLIRRVTFDLTGLPPTPAEVDDFVRDTRPDAYERVVDRLLASPHYGERRARMWMDVARYADTKGYVFTDDRNYYFAYTYRNWLIDAFNKDLPYDQFIIQQLAADRLELGDDRRPLAALGYLTLGRRFINNLPDIIDDRIDVTMRGFQGLTVGCARCHDHKFDPIPTQDYYSLYAVFASSQENQPAISPKEIREPWEKYNARVAEATGERENLIRSEVAALREKGKTEGGVTPEVKAALQAFREHELPPADKFKVLQPAFAAEKRERLAQLDTELDQLKKSPPPAAELAHAMTEGGPYAGRIFKRGNPGNPGDPAPRRFVSCIAGANQPEWSTGGRLELARAIANPDNPLTARVFVNRLWLVHFGFGLVRTPSDFGRQGEKPTNPELLDWLAWTFSHDDHWSIKKLTRRIVLSETYRQVSDPSALALQKDPENRLLSHQNRRRLDMEQMRDSLMMAAGDLDLSQVGGKSEDLWGDKWSHRRAVYGFVERQNLPGTFKTFDFATPDVSSPVRFQTTVPQQALFVLNSPLAAEQARALARLPEVKSAPDDAGRIRALYRRLFGRLPAGPEGVLGKAYLAGIDRPAEALAAADAGPWQYGWGTVDGAGHVARFEKLPAFVENAWRGGRQQPDPTLGWVTLTSEGGHPGNVDHAVIRRWTAPADLTLRVAGKLVHPSEQGDGVRARVISSRQGVVGEWVAQHGEAQTAVASVDVRKGDTLDFVVDCRTNEAFDSFAWAPRLHKVASGAAAARAESWDARAQFAGPPPAPAAPLNRLERYAQALLMSNEFFFID